MIRQKLSSLALCLVMLMTMFTPIQAHAEEKLIKADVGVFSNGALVSYTLSGTVITDNKYKFIIKDTEGYNCSNANGFSYSSTDLDEVLAKAEVYKKGETIYATFTDDTDMLLVYSDSDEKKYEIALKKLSKYCDNTTTNHTVTVTLKSALTDSDGQVIGNTYSFNGVGISRVNIYTDENNYFTYSNDSYSSTPFNVDLTGANGTYTYEVTMADDYVVTGTLTQSGVTDPGNVSQNNTDELAENMPPAEKVKNPTVTLSKIPTKKCDSFKLTITSDIDAQFAFNGEVVNDYKKEATFTVNTNGTLFYSATTAEGGYTEGTVEVKCIKEPADEEKTPWTDNDWGGKPSGKAGQNNLVQTGLFDNGINFSMYIGAVLVLLGAGILVAKKKGFSLKKGGTR